MSRFEPSCFASSIGRWLIVVSLQAILMSVSPAKADQNDGGPGSSVPVHRKTNDRDQDLIDALVDRQRFDEAIDICRNDLKRFGLESDEGAKAAVRWSRILTRVAESKNDFGADAIAKAMEPVEVLLDAYADHRRAVFLEAQQARVQYAASRQAVVMAAVAISDESQVDAASTTLARVKRRFDELVKKVEAARIELEPLAASPKRRSLSADLDRLRNELRIDIVSMALLQTDLFPPESLDQLGAANKAIQVADDALKQLPVGSPARWEIQRLRVEAILHSGDYPMAEQGLTELASQLPQPIPPRVLALRVDLDLAQGKLAQAGKRLQRYFGDHPEQAERSVDMDLSRLAYLIAVKDDSVGRWLEAIEQRGGAYARRRAEAITLGNLQAAKKVDAIDPAIVAAQGSDWLRRGDPLRAASLLAAAATAERDGDLAIKRAANAAAAFLKAKQPSQAAEILASVSLAHATANKAADAHLQAAVVISQSRLPDAATQTEAVLLQVQQSWPQSQSAAKARRWLMTLLQRQHRHQKAAKWATSLLNETSAVDEVDAALAAWIDWVVQADSTQADSTQVISEFKLAMEPLRAIPVVQQRYPLAAVFVLDRADLTGLTPTALPGKPTDAYAIELLKFRRSETGSDSLSQPPDDSIDAVRWRLMRDGHQDPSLRGAIAKRLNQWAGDWSSKIPLLVWADKNDEAIALAKQSAASSNQPAAVWRSLAQSLAQSTDPNDWSQAIEVWDQLASGQPKSSDDWHESKLAAIDLLIKTGDREQAVRRAKYILLTDTPADATVRKRYESIAGQP